MPRDFSQTLERLPGRFAWANGWLWALAIYTAALYWTLLPTFPAYMWTGHDTRFPSVRIERMARVWEAGGPLQAPWTSAAAFGYGWPFFTFYAPLGYMAGAAGMTVLGLGPGGATKLSFYLALWLSGFFMGGLAAHVARREGWPDAPWLALACALTYALAPYHLTDMFVRVTLAEGWAWAMVPACFWATELCRDKPFAGMAALAFAYAGLMLSHNIMALYGTAFIAAYAFLTVSRWTWPFVVAAGGALGAGLSAFFWLPALKLLPKVVAGDPSKMWAAPEMVHNQAIYWRQHLIQGLGRAGGADSYHYKLDFALNLGYATAGVSAMALLALFRPGLKGAQRFRLAGTLTLLAATLFAMSPQMRWDLVPAKFCYVQFPWRLLLFAGMFGCLAYVRAAPVARKWAHPLAVAGFAALLGAPSMAPFLLMVEYPPFSDKQLEAWYAHEEFHNGLFMGCYVKEYAPVGADPKYLDHLGWLRENNSPPSRLEIPEGAKFELLDHESDALGFTWRYRSGETGDIEATAHVFHFPGWRMFVDGMPSDHRVLKKHDGLVTLFLPPGQREIRFEYWLSSKGEDGRAISWATLALLLLALGGRGAWLWRERRDDSRSPSPESPSPEPGSKPEAPSPSANAPEPEAQEPEAAPAPAPTETPHAKPDHSGQARRKSRRRKRKR